MTLIVCDIRIRRDSFPVIVPAVVAQGTPFAYHLAPNDAYSIVHVATGESVATGLGTHQACERAIAWVAEREVGA